MAASAENPTTTPQMSTLSEIRDIMAHVKTSDLEGMTAALQAAKALPDGPLKALAVHLAPFSVRQNLKHPRVALYISHIGAHPHDNGAQQRLEALMNGTAPLNSACKSIDTDLQVYEMALEVPTAATPPYMSEPQCAEAIAYGMMAVEAGVDVLTVGSIAAGHTDIAQGVLAALKSGEASSSDSLEILKTLGSLDLAACVGAVMAARFGLLPVVLSGATGEAVYRILAAQNPKLVDHCVLVSPVEGIDAPAVMSAGCADDTLTAVAALPVLKVALSLCS